MKKIYLFLIILFIAISGQAQTNNVLLEFCTGTWCQWCPCGKAAAESVLVYRPNTLVLAYHGGPTSTDPFRIFNGNDIINLLGFTGYPNGSIGRRTGALTYPGWYGQCLIQSNNYEPAVSYTVNRHYNPATRTVDYTAIVTALRDIDTNCNINFVIYENNLVYSQTGNSTCPGGTFTHKWVVRNMVNSALGEVLSTGHWAQGTTKTKTWTTTLDAAWVSNNCDIGLFVYFQSSALNYSSYVLQTKKEPINTFPTGVVNQSTEPLKYKLAQNYPNPFNPKTNIHFSIPKDGVVSLKIYDVRGNLVTTFSNGFMKAGEYNAEFDGSNLSSGVYFYKLIAGDFSSTKKMILAK